MYNVKIMRENSKIISVLLYNKRKKYLLPKLKYIISCESSLENIWYSQSA